MRDNKRNSNLTLNYAQQTIELTCPYVIFSIRTK